MCCLSAKALLADYPSGLQLVHRASQVAEESEVPLAFLPSASSISGAVRRSIHRFCGRRRMVAVGTAVASRPPRRSRRAAFPHRLLSQVEAFGVLGTHVAPIRGLAASMTCRTGAGSGACVATHPPLTGRRPSAVSAADATRLCSRLHRYNAAVRLLIRVHAHRLAVAFMGRSGVLAGYG